jgi:hypothetical protein
LPILPRLRDSHDVDPDIFAKTRFSTREFQRFCVIGSTG